MKNAKQLQKQIDDLISVTAKGSHAKRYVDRLSDAEIKRNKKRIEFLRQCRNYLETNPTESFVQKMHDDLTRRIKTIDDDFQIELERREKNPQFNPKSNVWKLFKKGFL